MKNKFGISIIGCGNIFNTHADAVQENNYAELISVVDIKKERAKKAASQYNCQFHTDYEEMLTDKQVDVVHICTPHYLHAPMAINSLRAGKHVLVEKPLAENLNNVQKIVKEVNSHPEKHVGVVFQNRYNDTSLKAKEIIEKGEIGQIKGIKGIVTWYRSDEYYKQDEWRGNWETEGGGVLINQSIHTLDLVQWLAGKLKAVKGNFDTRVLQSIEVEDTADATLFFENGAIGIFFVTNCYSTNSPVEVEIHGEEGLLAIRDNDLVLKKKGQSENIQDDEENKTYKSYWGQGHKNLIDDFYDNILKDNKDYITVRDGIKSMEIIHGIYESSNSDEKYMLN